LKAEKEVLIVKEISKNELLDKLEQSAEQFERELHGCGRCALAALIQHFELTDESAKEFILKALLPLSGGIAGTQNTCGALLAGLMAIGMASFPGKVENADIDAIRETMALGRKYYRQCEKELGNVHCRDIRAIGLGRSFDTADPDEYERFIKAGGYELCSRVVGRAARLAGEYILDIKEQQGNPPRQ
jgi:C_GCAxxG_C_C family probable redox protein